MSVSSTVEEDPGKQKNKDEHVMPDMCECVHACK